ncbi:hypothetical protein TrRE_jg4365 [Triparma retinervis]|uniref:Uncharacterized protein n=1 Tax=Triparma retinervis TaxID=2557542 RepID=A0A9W7FBF8_9STRA|nr:hypothetical protein TrRE_jg4365 [Triparma retinervis]
MQIKSTSLISELASHPGSVKVFLLLPSSTSSPSAMLLAETTCQSLGIVKELLGPVLGDDTLHIIRLDDYLMHGDRVVSALAESGKRVYPKEEATSMLMFFVKVFDLAEPLTDEDVEEGQEALIGTLRPQSRFDARFKHALGTDVVLVPEGAEDGEVAKSKFPGIFTEGENVPILLIDAKADLAFKPPHWCCRAMKFLEVTRENYDGLVVTVVVHESLDAMKKEHFLLPALAHMIENSIVTIFCTEAEVPQCKTFFAGAKFDEEDVVMLLAMQGIPFPRMHQFTFGTAMGEEIEDSSLLGAAVTVGTSNEGSGLDAMKFYANREGAGKNGSLFVLQDSDFKPMVERLIVGRTDGISTTLIKPGGIVYEQYMSGVDIPVPEPPEDWKDEEEEE